MLAITIKTLNIKVTERSLAFQFENALWGQHRF